jgi:hypothetical protein
MLAIYIDDDVAAYVYNDMAAYIDDDMAVDMAMMTSPPHTQFIDGLNGQLFP